jgi:PAS domain S-box-containing protein
MDEHHPEDDGTARYRHLIAHIQDAVVEFELVDGEPIVRRVNGAFVDAFGYERSDLRDESLNRWIVPDWKRDEARALDERTAAGEVNYRRVKRETTGGLREFLYRSVPYEDDAVRTDGFAVYTDLTDITQHQRRLQVLNRVLRHNLRNEANVVVGNAARLADRLDGADGETGDAVASVREAASRLERLTREAGDIVRMLSRPDPTPGEGQVDCVRLARSVVRTHRRSSPAADIELEGPDSKWVGASERLQLALDSLVDNAIEHNPAETPRVRVVIADDDADGWVRLRVEDDGPIIPETERVVVTGDAEITPTRHASGLGLWLVRLTTDAFGGELSFSTGEWGGNAVDVRLPEA